MEILVLTICVVLTLALFSAGLINTKEDQKVQERFELLSQETESKKSPLVRQKALEGSFSERVLFPFAQKIFDNTQKVIPLSSKSWVRTKLIQAGYLKPHYQKVFLGIQLLSTCLIFGFFFSMSILFGKVPPIIGFVASAAFGLFGYGLPMVWLVQQAQKRQTSIQKSLPDFIDLLVICVEAGLGLDMAINKLSQMRSERTSTYLRDELVHYTKDVSLGKPRKNALLDMAARTGVDDFQVIINSLVQSYEMGTGVAHTLRVQSDSLRVKRLQRAEERANKIPVKMIMPIYMFLFPAIFIAIFGPMGMVMIKAAMKILDTAQIGG